MFFSLLSDIDPAVDVPLTAALVVPVGPAVVELIPVGDNWILYAHYKD